MKQRLLLMCLVFSSMSIGQIPQVSINEVSELKSNSLSVFQNNLVVEQISNEKELNVNKIERPKVSKKEQISTTLNEKSKN